MVDSNRQFNPPNAPAAPFEVIGVNGIGQLPTPRLPAVPDIQVEDTTAQNIAVQRDSMNRAFDYASQQIQSTVETQTRIAEQTSRNAGRNTAQGLVGALAQGYEIYKGLQDSRRERELEALGIQQAELGAAYEIEVRNIVQDLQDHFIQEGFNEGSINSFQTTLNQLNNKYRGRIDPQVLRTVNAIGFDALQQVTSQYGQRMASEAVEARDAARGQIESELRLNISSRLAALSNAPRTTDFSAELSSLYQEINQALNASGLRDRDRAVVSAGLLNMISEGYAEITGDVTAFAQQQQVLDEVLTQANEVWENYSGDERLLNISLQRLQLRLNDVGLDFVNLSDLNQSDRATMLRDLEFQKQYNDAFPVEESTGFPSPTNAMEREARNNFINGVAYDWMINPGSYSFEISQARNAEPGSLERAQYDAYQLFSEQQERYRELQNEILDLDEEIAKADAEFQQVLDRADPGNRLGVPQTFTDWGNVLENALLAEGVQVRPEISREVSQALQRYQSIIANNTITRKDSLLAEQTVLRRGYLDSTGIDLANPASPESRDAVVARLESSQEVIQQMQRRHAAERQRRSSPANFRWGLESLPPLQPHSTAPTGLPQLPMGSP